MNNNIKSFNILFSLIIILSWILNIGWIRLIFLIPMIIHAIIFYFANRKILGHINTPAKMKIKSLFAYLTLLLFHVLLSDVGDTDDSMRVFFGLIKNERIIDLTGYISGISFILNLILLVILFIDKSKRKSGVTKKQINREGII